MGMLEEVLASIDNARRVAGRNVRDLTSDPSAYADKIVGHLRNTNAGVSPVVSGGELTNRPLTMTEQVDQTLNSIDFGGGLGVIKPKGGNWLSGKYGPEAHLKSLRKYVENDPESIAKRQMLLNTPIGEMTPFVGQRATPEAMERWKAEDAMYAQHNALNNWIDNQLTKYVKNDMAAPTDPIRKLADTWPAEQAQKLAVADARVKALRAKQEAQAATRGVPEEYLTRTRQEVLAAEEARDLIAENRGLHYEPPYDSGPGSNAVQALREAGGFPKEGMADTALGSAWENTADSVIGRGNVSDFQLLNNLKQDPWLAKADPNAPVYSLKVHGWYETDFSHLTDELTNSLREGRLSPEQLAKMPIDQAVRHVAEINALRAVKSKQAQAMEMQGMPLHKDYPDQGMSWRQLKLPGNPNEWQRQFNARKDAMHAEAKAQGKIWKWPRALDEKIKAELGPRPYDRLQKWLTQEGDAMGHCVGGYCDDVVSGRSNIYSLRDAKGKPYVTIETTPPDLEGPGSVDDAIGDRLWGEAFAKFGEEAEGTAPFMKYIEDGMRAAAKDRVPMIAQIKGPQNKAPAAEHLPFVQDFIRSGKWSDIQDLEHTGLTQEEIDAILKR